MPEPQDFSATLSALDWSICIGYLLIVVAMGLWFAREQHSNEEYFVGSRRMNWVAIGLSLFASTFSSLSFVGLPSAGAHNDYHLLLAILFIPVVITPIVCWIFVPLYRRVVSVSVYEYLERRFNRPIRLAGSTIYSLYTICWIGTMLVAVGVILQRVLNLSEKELQFTLVGVGLFATLYTAIGGVKAVVWTDVLQAVTLGGGMLLVLFFAVTRIDGGWQTVFDVGNRYDKFDMFNMKWDLTQDNFWGACAFGLFVYMGSKTIAQGAVQRYVSTPTVSTTRWALVINAVMTGGVCAMFFLVGSVLFVFYHQSVPIDAVAGSAFPELPRKDQLLPHFVLTEIPVLGLTGLLLAGLFAAAMSSVDSGINNLTALVVYDWLAGRKITVRFSRLLCGFFGIAVVGAALIIQQLGGRIFPILMKFTGAFFGPLLAIFFLGVFFRRANSCGAVIGLVAGCITVLCVSFAKELSEVLNQSIGWQPDSLIGINQWWFGLFGFAPTFIVGLLVSYALSPPPPEKTDGLVVKSLIRPWD